MNLLKHSGFLQFSAFVFASTRSLDLGDPKGHFKEIVHGIRGLQQPQHCKRSIILNRESSYWIPITTVST